MCIVLEYIQDSQIHIEYIDLHLCQHKSFMDIEVQKIEFHWDEFHLRLSAMHLISH